MSLAAALLLSYLAGSIPTGLWLGLRLRGVDIREHGSHNIGATNTLRVLGKKLGAAALAGDMLKGIIAVALLARLSDWAYAALACGLMAILGHTYSVFLRFRGGKGVATSAGVFLALCPGATLLAAVIFAVTVALTRMASAASMLSAIALVVAVYTLPHAWTTYPTHALADDWIYRAVVTAVGALVIIKHRSNLGRILRGEENRL